MNNKHLVNIALQHIKEDNPHGVDDIKKGMYNDIDGIHADLNTVKTEVIDYSDTLPYHFEDKIELARLGETIIDGGTTWLGMFGGEF